MKSLKKSFIAVLVIGTLSVAGMAFAHHGDGNGQSGPMGPFGGPRHMGMRQWNGNNLPPAPPMGPNGAPCFCGRNGQMGWQHAPFQPAPGQGFNGQGFGHRGGPCGGRFQPHGMFAPNMPQGFCSQGFGHGRGPAFGPEGRGPRGEQFHQRGMFAPDMPQDIRAKVVEAEKLHIDLENVLSQKPLNKDKAIELNGQISRLRQEVQAWRFEQKLGRIEEFNRKAAEEAEAKQDK